MLRDFTKSNKDYFSKNKITIIGVSLFLVIALIIFAIFGLNGNFEFNGYNEFSIKAGADATKYNQIVETTIDVVESYNADYDGYLVYGEGENTEIIIRYTSNLTKENQAKINSELASELNLTISEHTFVKGVVDKADYIYTAVAILILLVGATLFAYFRYNGASAIAIIFSCILATLGFVGISTILRLSIGLSYFAMLTALNILVVFFALNIFESIRNSSFLGNKDYAAALKYAIQDTKLRISLISIAVMIIGVLFVVAAPITLKYVCLNILFMPVVALIAAWGLIPFFWSVFITNPNNKTYKVKVTKEDTNK